MAENLKSTRRHAMIYLSGLTISAFGSLATAATLPALLFDKGISTLFIGFLIGSLRINSFMVNLFFGHVGDKFNPRTVMIACEAGAAVGSVLIWISWRHYGTTSLLSFFVAYNIRVFFTALQSGSVQKFGKIFDEKMQWAGKMAVWLNGATNGSLLFAGLLAIYFFRYLTIELVIAVDFLTFLINGILLLILQHPARVNSKAKQVQSFKIGRTIGEYYRNLPILFAFDLVLSLALCGSNTLNVRLLEGAPQLVPLMPAIFGGAAFLTSFATSFKVRPESRLIWLLLSASLVAQGLATPYPWLVLIISAMRNICYWLIYQAISREFMQKTSSENYAAAAAGRSAATVAILASGEFWVGLTRNLWIVYELGWRAVVALLGSFIQDHRVENNDKL